MTLTTLRIPLCFSQIIQSSNPWHENGLQKADSALSCISLVLVQWTWRQCLPQSRTGVSIPFLSPMHPAMEYSIAKGSTSLTTSDEILNLGLGPLQQIAALANANVKYTISRPCVSADQNRFEPVVEALETKDCGLFALFHSNIGPSIIMFSDLSRVGITSSFSCMSLMWSTTA